MKLTKRLLALCLILAMWLSLTGCGGDTNPADNADATASSTAVSTSASTGGEASTTITVDSIPVTATITNLVTPSVTTTTATGIPTKPTPSVFTTQKPTTTTTAKPTTTTTVAAPTTEQLLVDAAFLLMEDESLQGDVSLTGTVTYVKEVSASYGNATFDLQVYGTDGPKTIYCYRVKPAEGTDLEVAVGDTLTLVGTVQNYRGTIEFSPATYQRRGEGITTTRPTVPSTTRPAGGDAAIDEDGIYDSKEEVALYIHTYGKLPKNYYPKSQFNKNDKYQCCGGDRFYNKEGRLPSGETYYECDIDTYGITSRGAKRLVWTKSGIVYYTGDHYETFTQLYGER